MSMLPLPAYGPPPLSVEAVELLAYGPPPESTVAPLFFGAAASSFFAPSAIPLLPLLAPGPFELLDPPAPQSSQSSDFPPPPPPPELPQSSSSPHSSSCAGAGAGFPLLAPAPLPPEGLPSQSSAQLSASQDSSAFLPPFPGAAFAEGSGSASTTSLSSHSVMLAGMLLLCVESFPPSFDFPPRAAGLLLRADEYAFEGFLAAEGEGLASGVVYDGSGLILLGFFSSTAQSHSSSFLSAGGAELGRASVTSPEYFLAFLCMSSYTHFKSSCLYMLAVRELYFSGIFPSSSCLCFLKNSRAFWFPPTSIDTSSYRFHVSISQLLTNVRCTPSDRWMPEQSRHMKIP
mmetsp:Transcript_43828/g.89530  ORF Transcript_43828/g.89530 Transcript_43828/m.89530 type:complete len:345 (-) Transcript_43828:226-1260(-)